MIDDSPSRRLGSSQRLVTGYNHNIPYGGVVYHVQTEFFANPPAHVDTHVFDDGRVVGSHRSDIEIEVDAGSDAADQHIVHVMKTQQKEMIRRLISGRLASPKAGRNHAAAPTRRASSAASSRSGSSSGQSVANLEIRRSLIRFVRAVRPDDAPDAETVIDRLRSVITTTAVILGRHVYDSSRQDELADLLIMRSEGLDWLRGKSGGDDGKGLRIWNGFARIARRFSGLNQRRELVAHDREVWDRVQRSLDGVPSGSGVDADLLESLKSTWGRDEELDKLLEFPLGVDVGSLRRAIEGAQRLLPAAESDRDASRSGQGDQTFRTLRRADPAQARI